MPALRELVHSRCLEGRPLIIVSRPSRHWTVPKLKSELSVLHTNPAPLPHDSALNSANIPRHLSHLACARALCRLLSTHWASPAGSCCHWSPPPGPSQDTTLLPPVPPTPSPGQEMILSTQHQHQSGPRTVREEDGHLQKPGGAKTARETAAWGWRGMWFQPWSEYRGALETGCKPGQDVNTAKFQKVFSSSPCMRDPRAETPPQDGSLQRSQLEGNPSAALCSPL